MMIVSIVMPETGLRAVVAMALAATDVKKNEKTSVRTSADRDDRRTRRRSVPKKAATPIALRTVPSRIAMTEMSRSVRSESRRPRRAGTPSRRCRTTRPRSAATSRCRRCRPSRSRRRRRTARSRGRSARPSSARWATAPGRRRPAGGWPIIQIERHEHEVREDAAGAEHHRGAQTHDVAEAEDEGDGVEA